MFFGCTAHIAYPSTSSTGTLAAQSAPVSEFSILLEENPLSEMVELPPDAVNELWYSNILCGVIRGALEMVWLSSTCFL